MNENQSINQQIAQVDEKLTILRESWQDSKPEKQPHWLAKINAALDERSALMKQRAFVHVAGMVATTVFVIFTLKRI